MPGKRLTDHQVRLYMENRENNLSQTTSAAKAGISENSGRRIENNEVSAQKSNANCHWRTRKDPLEGIWDNELKPMLEAEPLLTADGLWEYLTDNYPDHGGQYMSDDFQKEIKFLGMTSSPSFVREPEGNGVIERFFKTLKEQLLWIETFRNVEELLAALHDFKERFNKQWIMQRHGYKTPDQVRAVA